ITGDARVFRTENVEPSNDWTRNPDGRDHLSRLSARYGPALLQRMDDYSATQLEPLISREIAKAIEARGKGGGSSVDAAQGTGQDPTSPGKALGVGGLLSLPAAGYQPNNPEQPSLGTGSVDPVVRSTGGD